MFFFTFFFFPVGVNGGYFSSNSIYCARFSKEEGEKIKIFPHLPKHKGHIVSEYMIFFCTSSFPNSYQYSNNASTLLDFFILSRKSKETPKGKWIFDTLFLVPVIGFRNLNLGTI